MTYDPQAITLRSLAAQAQRLTSPQLLHELAGMDSERGPAGQLWAAALVDEARHRLGLASAGDGRPLSA